MGGVRCDVRAITVRAALKIAFHPLYEESAATHANISRVAQIIEAMDWNVDVGMRSFLTAEAASRVVFQGSEAARIG